MKGLDQFIWILFEFISVNKTYMLFNIVFCFILDFVLSMPHGNMIVDMKLHHISPMDFSNQVY